MLICWTLRAWLYVAFSGGGDQHHAGGPPIHLCGGWSDRGDHKGDRRLNNGCSVGGIVGVLVVATTPAAVGVSNRHQTVHQYICVVDGVILVITRGDRRLNNGCSVGGIVGLLDPAWL